MRILVTAGNTQTLIDRVRCLTNIFSGRTGAQVAFAAWSRGHDVRFLTSHPEVIAEVAKGASLDASRWSVNRYQTFSELRQLMERSIVGGGFDAVIHSAAVGDYESAGVYVPEPGTKFDPEKHSWSGGDPPRLLDAAAGKVKSSHEELWLRLIRTPKLVDMIRDPWGFRGILIKFKLEVGLSESELLKVAEESRRHSHADLMVANTLEGMKESAYLGAEQYRKLPRARLAEELISAIERLAKRSLGRGD